VVFLIAKIHESQLKKVLAACDKEHLGKTFSGEKIEFTVKEKFFKGEPIDEEKLCELLEEVDAANLFGDKCVSIAEKKGLISKSGVILIGGVKHAQIYKV
jgi:hypothetical protein